MALNENRPCWPLPPAFYLVTIISTEWGALLSVLLDPREKATHWLVLFSAEDAVSGAWGASPGAGSQCPFSRLRSAPIAR